MKSLFRDIPEAIVNIKKLLIKLKPYELARDVLLPAFDIPDEFETKMMKLMEVNVEKMPF